MNFASDNWAGAHPEIAAALSTRAGGVSPPYQSGEIDRIVERQFCDLFGREVKVYFVATGTAANALAMAALARPGGVAFCQADAHLLADEGGAVEHLADGLRLRPVPDESGRIDPVLLEDVIARHPANSVQSGRMVAVSVSQSTEIGTIHDLSRLEEIGAVCRRHGMALHMDGARFANALVALDVSPAEMTWKRGVDLLSFGATKNGCWCAEVLVVFDPEKAGEIPYLRKRAGHLFSKTRFVAAQLQAYFAKDLWLSNARHANRMAAKLAATLEGAGARLQWPVEANMVFPVMKKEMAARLTAAGAHFHIWKGEAARRTALQPDEGLYRFVASFATEPAEIERLAQVLG